tara:strand:- start:3065 stop:3859 length:795 start_codon:yes stop_codon:yes gene_type:complete
MAYVEYTITEQQEIEVEVYQSITVYDENDNELQLKDYDVDGDDINITIEGTVGSNAKVQVYDEHGKEVTLIEDEYDDDSEPNKVTLEGFVISKEEMHEYKKLKQASNDLRVLVYISEEDKKDICQRAHTTDINDKSIWLTPDTKDTLGSDLEPWTESKLIRCTLQKDDHKTILRSMASQIIDKCFPEKEEEDSNEISRTNDAIKEGLDAVGESKHPVHNLGTITISEDSKHKIENPKTNLHIKDDTGNEEATQEILNSIGISDQ